MPDTAQRSTDADARPRGFVDADHERYQQTAKRFGYHYAAQHCTRQDHRHPLLKGHEGWRVEVTYADGTTERFIVGATNGYWRTSLRIKTRRSRGGDPVESSAEIMTVQRLYHAR